MKLPGRLFFTYFFVFYFFTAYFSVSVVFSAESLFHIVLDPGHGGQDLGAVRDSFVESKIVLQIAQKVKANLDQRKNIKTTLTRNDGSWISLKERVRLANEQKADLFISLHANTSNSKSASGMEFYFNSSNPKRRGAKESAALNNQLSNKLANKSEQPTTSAEVIEKIKSDFRLYDKTEKSLALTRAFKAVQQQKSIIRRAPFYVIDHTSMPSALIELGFISNRREAKKLISEDYQNEMARLLTLAILEYKEKSDKPGAL